MKKKLKIDFSKLNDAQMTQVIEIFHDQHPEEFSDLTLKSHYFEMTAEEIQPKKNMDKDKIYTIVSGIIIEVSTEYNLTTIHIKRGMEFEDSIEIEWSGCLLPRRDLKVRFTSGGYEVTSGMFSPSHNTADLIQRIIVGKVAERMLLKNF